MRSFFPRARASARGSTGCASSTAEAERGTSLERNRPSPSQHPTLASPTSDAADRRGLAGSPSLHRIRREGKNGWFGGVRADGSVDGFDPTTGQDVPGQPSADTANAAGAAVAYAVAKGNLAKVKEYYSGPEITGIVE